MAAQVDVREVFSHNPSLAQNGDLQFFLIAAEGNCGAKLIEEILRFSYITKMSPQSRTIEEAWRAALTKGRE